ncbi:MAG: NAD(P)/FAD-dependent oxidoreductase [Desulfovibrio sp.]
MLRLTDLRLPLPDGPAHAEAELRAAAAERLGLRPDDIAALRLVRRSLDARKKNAAVFLYSLDVSCTDEAGEARVLAQAGAGVSLVEDQPYRFPVPSAPSLSARPVVVGAGPCGLFAALALAQAGFAPLLLERGQAIEDRARTVDAFWQAGELAVDSNVQFGEGGAGAFSDGKLTTQIKERRGRCRKVLSELVAHGAPEDILWRNRPHVGTDRLRGVVAGIRASILRLGGQVRFGARVEGILERQGRAVGVRLAEGPNSGGGEIAASCVILAVGHSARDTFSMLLAHGLRLEQKPFAIGCRIEHPQALIDRAQLRDLAGHPAVGPADYKLAHQAANGRSVYTFCMCPGGQVIAASSEPGGVVTNGMSLHARDGANANSALLVGVGPQDLGGAHPLAGVDFQRQWERLAFELGGRDYRAPAQSLGNFLAARAAKRLGGVAPTYAPGVVPQDLRGCLPDYVCAAMAEGVQVFDRKLRGFADPDALLTGVETRSSSPVRILRGPDMQSVGLPGLFPAGEGAGYAGGIVSSAVDGLRVAEAVALTLCGLPVGDLEGPAACAGSAPALGGGGAA